MRNYHTMLVWASLPMTWAIPQPDYMRYWMQHAFRSDVLPNIAGW